MPFVKVAHRSGLAPETVTEVFVGEQPYAICNTGDAITALSGICPHAGGPLGQGQVRDGLVICPFHLWEFDAVTGACAFNPARAVATFNVGLEGDDVLVEVA
jgi:nitrite reductase/ring-hydroxylating ferredoxin subunit